MSVAYRAGLRVSKVVALKVSDIDSKRMLLRVERGKGCKDRHAMLSTGTARTVVRLVPHWPAAGLAISRSRSHFADDDAPAHARLPCRGSHGRDQQAGDAAHLAA